MWKVEKYIKDNLKKAVSDEPMVGHEERFLLRLEKYEMQAVRKRQFSTLLKVAATLALLVSIMWLTFEPFKTSQASSRNQITTIELPSDLTQILRYYEDQISTEVDEIAANSESNGQTTVFNQAAHKQINKLDAKLISIEKEFAKNPGNEAVKAALVNTQRKKAEIVTSFKSQSQTVHQGYRVGQPYTQF